MDSGGHTWKGKTEQEIIAAFQAKGDGRDWTRVQSEKAGQKWLEMESGLKEELMELDRGLDLGDEREK